MDEEGLLAALLACFLATVLAVFLVPVFYLVIMRIFAVKPANVSYKADSIPAK